MQITTRKECCTPYQLNSEPKQGQQVLVLARGLVWFTQILLVQLLERQPMKATQTMSSGLKPLPVVGWLMYRVHLEAIRTTVLLCTHPHQVSGRIGPVALWSWYNVSHNNHFGILQAM